MVRLSNQPLGKVSGAEQKGCSLGPLCAGPRCWVAYLWAWPGDPYLGFIYEATEAISSTKLGVNRPTYHGANGKTAQGRSLAVRVKARNTSCAFGP